MHTNPFLRTRDVRFLILLFALGLFLFLKIPRVHAQCVASCPSGQTQTGECSLIEAGILCSDVCIHITTSPATCPDGADPSGSCSLPSVAGKTCGAASAPVGGTSGPSTPLQLPNPLGTSNVAIIIGRIIKVLTGGAGMIGLFMFVYGGFQWLTAAGSPERIKKGKDIILWSLIGLVVMFSSYIATKYIIDALVLATG